MSPYDPSFLPYALAFALAEARREEREATRKVRREHAGFAAHKEAMLTAVAEGLRLKEPVAVRVEEILADRYGRNLFEEAWKEAPIEKTRGRPKKPHKPHA